MVQKLKGTMRVYCRVKPLNSTIQDEENEYTLALRQSTSTKQHSSCVNVVDNVELPISLDLQTDKELLTYHFDGVFKSNCSQMDVFEEVKPFVQSAIDGENVCIFAYG